MEAQPKEVTLRKENSSARNLVERFLAVRTESSSRPVLGAFWTGLLLLPLSGLLLGIAFYPGLSLWIRLPLWLLFVVFLVGAPIFALKGVGAAWLNALGKDGAEPWFVVGLNFLQGKAGSQEVRKSIPAPEQALVQFVSQVRAYANEMSYHRGREMRTAEERRPGMPDPTDLLKRRWADVNDTLNEYEIYLANDPAQSIDKIVAKFPSQNMDVSQVFRDVAECYDATWRRKGVNIETAIVTPLRAFTNEMLLRRLLVGPWRASVYFARRGNGVVFAAKSIGGRVVATWECNGLCIPESYLAVAQDQTRSVNERIELGMEVMAADPQSSHTFFGLLSLVIWIELAKACNLDYKFKNNNEGFVIELRLGA